MEHHYTKTVTVVEHTKFCFDRKELEVLVKNAVGALPLGKVFFNWDYDDEGVYGLTLHVENTETQESK